MSVDILPTGQPTDDATNRPTPPSSNTVTMTPQGGAPNAPAPQPSTQPTTQPAANAPQTSAPTQQPQPVQPHPISRMFDGILKNLSGPITVTDPVTGERRDVPQSRGTMAKSILASALAGLMTPNSYRDTPYGPVNDVGGNIAAGAKAGAEFQAARQAKAQQLTNDQQAAKLMTIANNAKLVQLQVESTHQKHVMLAVNNENAQAFLTPFSEYDKVRTPDQPPAFIAQSLSGEDAINGGHKLTDSNVVLDGTREVYNPDTKQMEEEPTYAVLNPGLGDIQLPKPVTDKLAEMNSQWKDIHRVVGGNVRVPVNAYVSAMHDYQAVTQGENTLNELSREVGGKNQTIDLAAAVKSNKSLLPVLYQLTQAGAGGNTVSNRPDNLLDTILKTPNGGDLLKLIGMTPEEADQKIQDIGNKRTAAAKFAAAGEDPKKRPADPGYYDQLAANAKAMKVDPAMAGGIIGGLSKIGASQAEVDAVNEKLREQRNKDLDREFQQKKENDKVASNTDDILTTPDALGYTPKNYGGSLKEYNKRQSALKKNTDETSKMEGTYQQFQSVLNDINAGRELTGAASVVALFNAIGISATPLAGKGFRINNNTVEEHANSISMPDNLVKKAVSTFKNGEVVTPQQIKDYATIAADTRTNQYVNLVNQAHGQGLNADFILPAGNGAKLDVNTAKIFKILTGGNKDAARKVAIAKGWNL
jgi:hypothetical protein